MNAQPKHDTAFGPTTPVTSEVTYASLADQIRAMQPRALTTEKLDDVLTIIEYVRDQALRIHDANLIAGDMIEKAHEDLKQREAEVTRREQAVDTKLRVLAAGNKARFIGKSIRGFFFRGV